MSKIRLWCPVVFALVAVAAGCGKSSSGPSTTATSADAAQSAAKLAVATPAATKDVGALVWATNTPTTTLDPVQAFNYPENTVITTMCESVLRQQPDGTLGPGLAGKIERPDPKTIVLTIRPGVRFWDGKTMTAGDVLASLRRAADPNGGGFYAQAFERVRSMSAGSDTVTLKLSKPDYWIDGELSSMAGIVYEKAFAEAKGKAFGTPAGGIMCTGAFRFKSWRAGNQLTVARNDDYWDAPHRAKASQITFKGVTDDASLTSGLLTGAIDGGYIAAYATLKQLRASDQLTVTAGRSYAYDALVISSFKGALGDLRVRQALSLAVDRAGDISTVYNGESELPRTLVNPGTWGYGRGVFQAAWDKHPDPKPDLAKARKLIKDAGATGKTIVLGNAPEIAVVNSAALAFREAGTKIGLKVKIKAVSAPNFNNFFIDPKFRDGVDGFPTVNYPDAADPALVYSTIVYPGANQNFNGFHDATSIKLLEESRGTADPVARARLVAEAGDRITDLLPWIPMSLPNVVLVTQSRLTGAPASFGFMFGPWATRLGGK